MSRQAADQHKRQHPNHPDERSRLVDRPRRVAFDDGCRGDTGSAANRPTSRPLGSVAVPVGGRLGQRRDGCLSLLVRGYAHGWYYVAGVLIVVSCVAQLAGEVALSCSASWLVRARLAAVVGATGVASAALLFADGHRIRSTCEGYCSQDMATGRRIEVVAVGVAVYAVLTTIRLLRPDRRSPALDAAVGVFAVALPVSYLVVAFFLGLH
jgi:hypothetical protein